MKPRDLAIVTQADAHDPAVGTLVEIWVWEDTPEDPNSRLLFTHVDTQPGIVWPMPRTHLEILPRFVTKQTSLARLSLSR